MSRNIYDAALRYLSSRSRSIFEMKKYLSGKGFDAEEIEALISDFCQCGYLDDGAYCLSYFRYAFGRGKGKKKVFYELREKGVDQTVMEIAFEDFQEEEGEAFDERARAFAEAEKVLRLSDLSPGEPVSEKIVARIGRKLQSKGYSSDVIYSVIGQVRK